MKDQREEFFKLDTIDRKVLFWLQLNSPKAVKSWIDYIAKDYHTRKSVDIDTGKLYNEIEHNRIHTGK